MFALKCLLAVCLLVVSVNGQIEPEVVSILFFIYNLLCNLKLNKNLPKV